MNRFGRHGRDFGSGRLRTFGKLAHLRSYDRKTLAMLASTGGFHRSIQGEQVGLASDFLDDRDFLGDRAHGRHSAIDCLA
ncbi:hypothetical protein D3C87_1664270 [compost metagenome]